MTKATPTHPKTLREETITTAATDGNALTPLATQKREVKTEKTATATTAKADRVTKTAVRVANVPTVGNKTIGVSKQQTDKPTTVSHPTHSKKDGAKATHKTVRTAATAKATVTDSPAATTANAPTATDATTETATHPLHKATHKTGRGNSQRITNQNPMNNDYDC